MPIKKIKKVIAKVKEVYVLPDFDATFECPYCGRLHHEEVFEENYTFIQTCNNEECNKKFKVKIPKYD